MRTTLRVLSTAFAVVSGALIGKIGKAHGLELVDYILIGIPLSVTFACGCIFCYYIGKDSHYEP